MMHFVTWSGNAKKSVLSTIRDGCQVSMAGQSKGSEFLKERVGLEERTSEIIWFEDVTLNLSIQKT